MKTLHFACLSAAAAICFGAAGCGLTGATLPAPAPSYLLSDLDGRPIRGPKSMDARAGEPAGVTVVEFFAAWCPACRGHVSALNAVQSELGGRGASVVGVALGRRTGGSPAPDPAAVRQFVKECGVRYPVALSDGRVVADYERAVGADIHFIPTTFVIDGAGRIVSRHVGGLDRDGLLREVRGLLAGSAAAAPDRTAAAHAACRADGGDCRRPDDASAKRR